jgi:signal transduction histidine kinase
LAQECLNNISQHSKASRVNISVGRVDKVLSLRIEDNGTGFDVEQALERKESFGLTGIRERVAVLGGSFSVSSTRKQGGSKRTGTVVQIELPIPLEKSS